MSAPAPIGHELSWRLEEAMASDRLMQVDRAIGDRISDDLGLVGYSNASDMATVRRASPDQMVPAPRSSLATPMRLPEYSNLGGERVVGIGAGTAVTKMASYLVYRGVDPKNITLIDWT